MVGVSGSVTIGDYAALGGNVGIAPHISIGPGASIAAKSGVFNDIPAGARWGGYPARPADEWLRAHAAVRRASRLGGAGKKSGAVGKKPRSAAGTGKGT
jgi:UDP-3-O-[3-hydroxymyristoyl] glucosamine N-acyltransferase